MSLLAPACPTTQPARLRQCERHRRVDAAYSAGTRQQHSCVSIRADIASRLARPALPSSTRSTSAGMRKICVKSHEGLMRRGHDLWLQRDDRFLTRGRPAKYRSRQIASLCSGAMKGYLLRGSTSPDGLME